MSLAVTEFERFTLLHVATRGDTGEAAKRLSDGLGIRISTTPGGVAGHDDGPAVLWFGPGRWLVHASKQGWRMEAAAGCAITDLSDSRRVFRLTGNGVHDYLAASCPLDIREHSMPPGSCAMTQFDRIPILLSRRSADEFDLYVERSLAPALQLPVT